MAFHAAGIMLNWQGENENETATNATNGDLMVRINPKFYRPAEVQLLIGNAQKAKDELNWEAFYYVGTAVHNDGGSRHPPQ
jgi:GDPmannose 4,6-dehydratase